MSESYDAVIVGAGHNGLVAANLLADAGWDTLVLEATPNPGGAVQSDELHPGFITDRFSSFYPMTAASPVIAGLDLESYGLRWTHAPKVLAHLKPGAPAAVLFRNAERTAACLDASGDGDGDAWRRLSEQWARFGPAMVDALLSPFPPVKAGLKLGWNARAELWDLIRMSVLPVRTLAAEQFCGADPELLLAGNALHADVTPDSAPSAFLGWLLVGLAQTVGFPVPVGGAGQIASALLRRLEAVGGEVRLNCPARGIRVERGRAIGVVTDSGYIAAKHGVVAACDAQILYGKLLRNADIPDAYMARMRQFQRANGTVKVDYALSASVPWRDERASDAGTVHLADSISELTDTSAQLANSELPADPFLLIGQMSVSDASRSPEGTESMWAYTHVPQNIVRDAGNEIETTGRLAGYALVRFGERMDARIEAHAPGFRDRIVARRVVGPDDMEAANPSLIGGDISGGTTQLHQQLIFRPVPGLARAETPISALFLGSSSAHPGGSVHGACGANAARAALARRRVEGLRKPALLLGAAGISAAALRSARRGSE